ncbi:hypothetical protein VitviT2T_006051 [Vitis vinifera]|uniref:Uncharacterized protein n=3 Tax=Vitis vinifera TaxID=29760 RepID=A0A438IQU9_VITVI|nr:uncharacterized protein LOC100244847 [Vitis vinifera]RVW40023.1 hypothetical protein CK203_088975 [Vitis vinifera]RVW99097.1 hypothetical protein CK203_019017 [Vitis vinifera]WJZ86609.1 hypothetical protein VitviT2T_006051 [Vitis vinifera]|eukprot:XP_002272681.1 PREDICTED: uncharacterized protein LOC100244847 [Vitis vinifera]
MFYSLGFPGKSPPEFQAAETLGFSWFRNLFFNASDKFMEICLIADTVSQGLSFAKILLRGHNVVSNNHLSVFDSSEQSSTAGVLQISAMIFPVDALAPPPVRSNSCKTARRTSLRRKRRTRRRSLTGDSENGEDFGFLGDGGDDGPFGGFGGGGRGWNFDRFGGHNWDESPSSSSDPAFDFVYEVICWIALSNCVHFAFKRVVRIFADDIGDASREKVPFRFASMC